jgi:tripartite-type tricarboxylate transporter receptor subunit TctC
MHNRRTILRAAALTAASVATPWALAQDYPSRPLRIVVPWPPGGLVDVAARAMASRLQASLAQTVIVENKVGAGGNIGADLVAKAPADGYTLLLTTSALTINAALRRRMPFDPVQDLEPIAALAYAPSVLVAHPQSGPSSVQDLVRIARSSPGKLSYASAGVGSPAHLAGELFKARQKLFIVHVPYTGAPGAMLDQIAGRIDFHFANAAVALPQVRSGKVRALAVTSAQRMAALPDVPTMAEAGVPNFEADQWLGLLAPRGLPRPVVERLVVEVNKALASDDLRSGLTKAGMSAAAPGSAAGFTKAFQQDLAKWAEVVQTAGIQAE